MELKSKIIISVVALAVAYAAGMHRVPKSVEASKEEEVKRETTTHEVTEVVKLPSGETRTITTTDKSSITDKTKKEDKKTIVSTSKINVSAIAGINVIDPSKGLSYGISVSKEIAGPITAGLWGLNNGTVGLSLGINF